MTIWRVSLTFQDRDGNERATSLCTSSATTVAELVAFAQGLEAALAPLSNARIVAATLTTRWEYSPGPASEYSDVRRKGLLITRDFEEPSTYESILIHSVAGVPGSALAWPVGSRTSFGWRTPLFIDSFGLGALTANRLFGRVVYRLTFGNATNDIIDLLDLMCRYDGTPFPADDFMYVELSQ